MLVFNGLTNNGDTAMTNELHNTLNAIKAEAMAKLNDKANYFAGVYGSSETHEVNGRSIYCRVVKVMGTSTKRKTSYTALWYVDNKKIAAAKVADAILS